MIEILLGLILGTLIGMAVAVIIVNYALRGR